MERATYQLSANPGDRHAPCALSAALSLPLHVSQATVTRPAASSAALSTCYCTLASRTRPDDARGHFAAPCSYQRLAPPSSLLFSTRGHVRPKSALLRSCYIRAVRSNGSCLLPFESTSFLSIYHNSTTNPSCHQELCLLHCAACQHQPRTTSQLKKPRA
jgi:hypothetical protein